MKDKFLDEVWFLGDVCTNHQQDETIYRRLVDDILEAGGIPKIQLFSEWTFDRSWPLPDKYVVSVFKPEDVDWVLSQKNPPLALKIASVESLYTELVDKCLSSEIPLIISTGGMVEDEVFQMAEQVADFNHGICLMHCMSLYPTPVDQINLQFIEVLCDVIDSLWIPGCVGWSCHTPIIEVCKAGVAALIDQGTKYEFHVKPNECQLKTMDSLSSLCLSEFQTLIEWTHNCVKPLWAKTTLDEREDKEKVREWRQRWKGLRN